MNYKEEFEAWDRHVFRVIVGDYRTYQDGAREYYADPSVLARWAAYQAGMLAMRERCAQGQKDSLSLLRRARNLLSHPPGWVDEPANSESRYALSAEIADHITTMTMTKNHK